MNLIFLSFQIKKLIGELIQPIIYLEGGNTFFLLQELRYSGADKLIIEHIKKGKPYISASAGSMVISEDIKYVRYMDDIESAPNLNGDFTGLSIIDFYVVPHYGNFPFKKSTKKIIDEYSDKYDLRPINNSQAIIIDGKKTEILTK